MDNLKITEAGDNWYYSNLKLSNKDDLGFKIMMHYHVLNKPRRTGSTDHELNSCTKEFSDSDRNRELKRLFEAGYLDLEGE